MTRTFGRLLLLSAAVIVIFHGTAGEAVPSSLGRIPEFQKKLNEKIEYEVLIPSTLDKVLDELLRGTNIPWTTNGAAFMAANQDRDLIKKTEIDKIDKLTGVTRATVLKMLLEKIVTDGGKATPTFVLRRDHLEITTLEAKTVEGRGVRTPLTPGDDVDPLALAPIPPLAYAAFEDVPLQDALKELARTTESTIVVDAREAAEAKAKVSADLVGVPLDAAVQLLADMANLKLVCVANVYYVTSPKNAEEVQKEEIKHRQEAGGYAVPIAAPTTAGTPIPPSADPVVKRN